MSQIDHPRTPYPKPEKSGPKPKKPLNPAGKVAREWANKKREFLKSHPPNHQGYWTCGICGHWVQEGQEEVDHIEKRSTNPELRYEDSNLRIVHSICNWRKKHEAPKLGM